MVLSGHCWRNSSQAGACWVLGAHWLNAGEFHPAGVLWMRASRLSAKAGSRSNELLNHGYVQMARLLQSPDDPRLQKEFADTKGKLAGEKNGKFFVDQLNTAYRFYSKRAGK